MSKHHPGIASRLPCLKETRHKLRAITTKEKSIMPRAIQVRSFAACDHHLPNLLRQFVEDDTTREARISNLATPNASLLCECRVPAHWLVRGE